MLELFDFSGIITYSVIIMEGNAVKGAKLLVWITQLGLSVAMPPLGFILLAVWLDNQFQLGAWVIVVGAVLGLICAADGLRSSLKAMSRMSQNKDKDKEEPPVSFNNHD